MDEGGFNAVIRADAEVSRAIATLDPGALAAALKQGGGGAGTIDLEVLLSVAKWRQGSIEIVRRQPSGRVKPALKEYPDADGWLLRADSDQSGS